jgi:3-hydroxyacyl-CoA dehydrogenase
MRIVKLGVVGAGVMGSGIAALAASAGVPVVLLDLPGDAERNGPALRGIKRALESKPPGFLAPEAAALVTPGNTEDDLGLLSDCDWVVEAIVELPQPKRELFAKLEATLAPGTVVSSNTSGLPIGTLCAGRSESFQAAFLGTHFFNPVRFLHLLEIIPTERTAPEVVAAVRSFAEVILGKGVVIAKDVPGFIANRLGLYGLFNTLRLMQSFDLSIDEVDALTGTFIGRPKSATFRTADIAGLDVLLHVSSELSRSTGEDFSLPEWVHNLVKQGRLGEKSGAGFYRREGKQIFTLDWKSGEYRPQVPAVFPELQPLEKLSLPDRLRALTTVSGRHADFLRASLIATAEYVLRRTPDLSHDIVAVDRAMEWGFAWEMGPFKVFDALGLPWLRLAFADRGIPEPELLSKAKDSFYRLLKSGPRYLTFDGDYAPVEPIPGHLELDLVRTRKGTLAANEAAAILDIGDGVVLLEFRSKMNTIGRQTIAMLRRALEIVERGAYAGLVIGNDDPRVFSAGANIAEVLAAVDRGDWTGLEAAAREFQDAIAALRWSPFPVVAAPFGIALGGATELALHSDRVQAHSELVMGFPEVGVGILPAAGGTKELLWRFSEELRPYEEADPFEAVKRAFRLIAMATTSSSALEARRLGFLREQDRISMNRDRLLADAKARVLELAAGYTAPLRRSIGVLGREALGNLHYAVWAMREAGYISEHDATIGKQIAYVLAGGDGPPREASEQDILDLEREALLFLLGTPQTRERMAHMLATGKPLRN